MSTPKTLPMQHNVSFKQPRLQPLSSPLPRSTTERFDSRERVWAPWVPSGGTFFPGRVEGPGRATGPSTTPARRAPALPRRGGCALRGREEAPAPGPWPPPCAPSPAGGEDACAGRWPRAGVAGGRCAGPAMAPGKCSFGRPGKVALPSGIPRGRGRQGRLSLREGAELAATPPDCALTLGPRPRAAEAANLPSC